MAHQEVKEVFKRAYGFPPVYIAEAPGRLELLGNHTDYNEGLVMSVAVDKSICIASAPRTDGRVELVSSAFPGKEAFWVTDLKKNPEHPWADYLKGVLTQLKLRGVHYSGFSAAIHGTIPLGVGMSSSAALEVAAALTLRQLYPYRLTEGGLGVPPRRDARGHLPALETQEKMFLAKLCQSAENDYVGVKCGLLDQISSLFGRAHHVMTIDFRHLSVDVAPIVGEAIVVCDSGVKHALVGGEYNELRQNCEEASRQLGARSLRSVELRQLKAQRDKLTARQYECAHHVVTEIQRVMVGERALREDDHEQFGQFMFQSHESSRDSLRNSCAELDLLVALARAHPACLGARLTGGGFGGATINLVRHHQLESFLAAIPPQYQERTGRALQPIVCGIVDGAC